MRRHLARRLAVALLALLVVGAAEAQKRRLPSRTTDVPDTESGRPAASAERPTFKGRLLIYGPQSLPVTPPPEHVTPAPETATTPAAPAPKPEPAPLAAPAPKPEPAPAPVVTPVPAPAAPVAAPLPTTPPPPVAKPEPAPPPPMAKPEPVPEPIPVAKPKPAPEPAPVAKPEPAPAPVPVAKPEPAPAPREPVVRLEPPKSAAPPAPPRQEVAIAAPSAAAAASAAAPVPIEIKLIESIFTCLAPGLPQDWRRAWVEITDQGGGKEKASKFRVSNLRGDNEGEPLVPCNAQELTRRIVGLNDKLPPDRRGWSRALLVIESDGEYELSYEYPK